MGGAQRELGATTEPDWRPDIQGMRALAVLLVIAYHADLPVIGGFIGVDVFFVISGFVITSLLVRRQVAGQERPLRAFWAGRVRRILPALSVVVFAVLVFSILFEDPSGAQQQTIQTAIATMLMVVNVYFERSGIDYFVDPTYVNPLLNMWSLAVEEQFYLVFPLVLLGALALTRNRRARLALPAVALGVLGALSFSLSLSASFGALPALMSPNSQTFAFFSMSTRAWEFAAGAGVALWATVPRVMDGRVRNGVGWLGLALVLGAACLLPSGVPFPGFAAIVPVAGAAALLVAGTGANWGGTRLLTVAPMQWVGDRSYSLYLWHWPVFVFAGLLLGESWPVLALALILTFGLSMITFRWVEQPFRHSSRRPAWRTLAAGGTAVTVLGLAVLAGQGVKVGWGQSWTLGAHEGIRRDCDTPPIDPERCRWGPADATGIVLVVGDSQAWAVADAVIDAAAPRGRATVLTAFNNCPFTAGVLPQDGPCGEWQQDVLDYIHEARPDRVIVANATYGGVSASLIDDVMVAVHAAGSTPVWLLNPPGAAGGARKSLLLAPAADRSIPRPQSELTAADLDSLRAQWGESAVVDPYSVMCKGETCAVASQGVEYYTDSNHLSVDGASLLVPLLIRALESLDPMISRA